MHTNLVTSLLLGGVLVNGVALLTQGAATYALLRREAPREAPPRWPSVSILKPLAGIDDDLWRNLESHLRLEYEGEYEVLLGVRSEQDPAWPVACAFAEKYPGRVRAVLQEGEPGLNPKINQLVTLTRYARYELLAVTDSNVLVPVDYLTEHACRLHESGAALSSNAFVGTGEGTLGSALDNMTLMTFCLPMLALAEVLLRTPQIMSKSMVLRRDALARIGGWERFKDLLAEDQRLGAELGRAGFETTLCRQAVANVQRSQTVRGFWERHSRWFLIRARVLPVGYAFEPLLNPLLCPALLVLATRGAGWSLALLAAAVLASVGFAQAQSLLARGRGFPLRYLLAAPLRDVLYLGAWVRGMLQRDVAWRGNRFRVGALTRLSRVAS